MPATSVVAPDGTPLAVRDRGSGPPVVCVHGTASSGADWGPLARCLQDDHRVVTYDRRGRGRSGDGAEYSFDREVDDVLAVLDHVGEPAHLLGHSYGARLALAAASRAAPGALRSLALYEPPIAAHLAPEEALTRGRAATEAQDWEAVLEVFQPVAGLSPEEIAFCRGIPAVHEVQLDAARTALREMEAARTAPVPRQVEAPALVLVGELTDSPVFLHGLDGLVRDLGADRVTLAGQRHVAMVGDAAGFAAALRPHLHRG